ncbi:MAG: hypothetical protein AB2L14_25765 [Candidatus Xenobiia bacterium LiM19]
MGRYRSEFTGRPEALLGWLSQSGCHRLLPMSMVSASLQLMEAFLSSKTSTIMVFTL